MTAIVMDYSNHFAWMKNSTWFRDAQAKHAAGGTVDYINPDSSEMADWTSGNLDDLKSAENADNVRALVEFLAAETGHAGTTYDAALVEKGRDLAIKGSWAGALNGTSCAVTIRSDKISPRNRMIQLRAVIPPWRSTHL